MIFKKRKHKTTSSSISKEAAMRKAFAKFNLEYDLFCLETEKDGLSLPNPWYRNRTGMILILGMNYNEITGTSEGMQFYTTGIGIPNAARNEFITEIRPKDAYYESGSDNSRSGHAGVTALRTVGIGAGQNRSLGEHHLIEATERYIQQMDRSFDGTDFFWRLPIQKIMYKTRASRLNNEEEGWSKGYFYLIRGHQEALIKAKESAEKEKAGSMRAWVPHFFRAQVESQKKDDSFDNARTESIIGRKYEAFTVLRNLSDESFLVTQGVPVESEEEWKMSQAETQTKASDAIVVTFDKAHLKGVRSSVFIDLAEIRNELPETLQESIGSFQAEIGRIGVNPLAHPNDILSEGPSVSPCQKVVLAMIALLICLYPAMWTWNATLAERSTEVPVSLTLHQQIIKAMEGPYGLLPKNQDKNSIAAPQNKTLFLIENNGSSLAFFAFAVAVLVAIVGIRYCLLRNPRSRSTRTDYQPPPPAISTPTDDQPPQSNSSSEQSQHPPAPAALDLLGNAGSSSMSEESTTPAQESTDQRQQEQEGCIFLVYHHPEAACNPRCEVFQRKLRRQPPYEDVLEEIDVEAALQTVLEMLQNGEVTECTMIRDGVVTTTKFKNYRQAHPVASTRSSSSLGDNSVAHGHQQATTQPSVINSDTIPSTTLQSKTVAAIPGSPVPKASDNEQAAGNSPESDSSSGSVDRQSNSQTPTREPGDPSLSKKRDRTEVAAEASLSVVV